MRKGKAMKGKIGLALGSGVARGWAHIGILQALREAGIVPDIIAGTSIGALAGGCYAAGKLDSLESFARSLTRRRLFGLLDFSLGGSGLLKGRKLHEVLEENIGDIQFGALNTEFICIATEMATGHEIWLKEGELANSLRASYALPGIFKPVKIDRRWLIDGALVNPIPVSVCRAYGSRIVIAVNLNADAFGRAASIHGKRLDDKSLNYDNGEDNGNNIEADSRSKLLFQQFFGKKDSTAPGISTVMFAALNITQDRIARSRLAGEPPDVTIAPRIGHIGLFDFDRADEAIKLGRKAVEKQIPRIHEMMEILG